MKAENYKYSKEVCKLEEIRVQNNHHFRVGPIIVDVGKNSRDAANCF